MGLEMESMASAIGVSVPVLRFLLCFVAAIPVSFVWRIVPGALPKHLYAAVTGAVLSYLSFGFSSNLHFLVPMAIGYASMLLSRRHCGVITFFAGFGYLIGCHVYYMSGDAWKEGGIDATGALMVLTLKVISCAINYSDGLLKEEGLREAQKKNRLIRCPSIIEYVGYCLCCGSHFAGPVYEMKDYLEWTENKGIWTRSKDRPSPSPYGATLRALIQAAICMGLYLFLVPKYPLSRFSEPIYHEWGFWQRLHYQYMSGFSARWKYYFIWSISEAAIIISGLGFSGWSDSFPPKPKWDIAKNVDVLGVEFATSAVQLPLVWNIQVSTWLRYYVYERLIQKGKKPGFLQLLATQTVSAVWHGLYPGYIIFFVQSALMIAGSRGCFPKEFFAEKDAGVYQFRIHLACSELFLHWFHGTELARNPGCLQKCIFCRHHRSHHIDHAGLCYQTRKTYQAESPEDSMREFASIPSVLDRVERIQLCYLNRYQHFLKKGQVVCCRIVACFHFISALI